jgi:predicted ATPase
LHIIGYNLDMIESVRFENFKVLKDATLRLGPLNVLVGANGSGKSTALYAIDQIRMRAPSVLSEAIRTVGSDDDGRILAALTWSSNGQQLEAGLKTDAKTVTSPMAAVDANARRMAKPFYSRNGTNLAANSPQMKEIEQVLTGVRVYAFEPARIGERVQLKPNAEMGKNGSGFAAALDRLRDVNEDAFDRLREDLASWLPEFDGLAFETPVEGQRAFKLRLAKTQNYIQSRDLSDGTLIALGLLFIAHDPSPRTLVCLEEPDRGLHPRLLKQLANSIFRLTYPAEFGLASKPTQVLLTTHSPIFLDFFRDHPEAIVVAEKRPNGLADFHRAEEDPHYREIIQDCSLGDVWFTGVLGGVPALK